MFKESRLNPTFAWRDIGDIEEGRPTLGCLLPVETYRMMKYALRDVLITHFDPQRAADFFFDAGRSAGAELCRTSLDTDLDVAAFLDELADKMLELGMGLMAVERADAEGLNIVLTVAEDLDCSGLPTSDETVCSFDEGFFAGVFEGYAGRPFMAKEIACWASGDRLCRFTIYAVD